MLKVIGFALSIVSCPTPEINQSCTIEPLSDTVFVSYDDCDAARRAAMLSFVPLGNDSLQCGEVHRDEDAQDEELDDGQETRG